MVIMGNNGHYYKKRYVIMGNNRPIITWNRPSA